MIKNHFHLIEMPDEEANKWVPVWNLEQFYISNDKSGIISPESIYRLDTYKHLNTKIEWDVPTEVEITSEEVDFSTEVTLEEAMEKFTIKPLSEGEVQHVVEKTKDFLRSEYTNDSGKWVLTGMYPERNYIITELTHIVKYKAFDRKLKVIINRSSMKIATFFDNQFFLDRFQSLEESDSVVTTKDEAIAKVIKHIEVTPVYVKDPSSTSYLLCARVECNFMVDATNGELIDIRDL
ncbi:hypothetical protein [Ornithinibacillus californiensis]|uniref:hypothetical protein n=1 Tax=Ornithinibacillus californiensis TaxID=161536 RepID=UPI00064DCBC5|nr:hypothetical protein [Ornithinibacillus californiensis]